MIGIIYLIGLGCIYFYAVAVVSVAKRMTGNGKVLLLTIAFGIPAAYPFLFLISPNYQEFNYLCSSNNQYKLIKSVETDVFPASSIDDGYRALLKKPYVSFTHGSRVYSRPTDWNSAQCRGLCTVSYKKKQCLENNCLTVNQLVESDQYIKYRSDYDREDQRGIFNSLLRKSTEQLVSEEHGVLAERYSYYFYPYGSGWAKILGAASGSAPSQRCESYSSFNYYEITPPTKEVWLRD